MSHSDVEIITYGGGELLLMVFNAISMLFYGGKENGGFIYPLCVVSATIGAALSISKLFFQSYTDAFLTKYFLPVLALPTILIVPEARVHIIDRLNDRPLVVDHVPFLFAKVAGYSSYWGYQITQAIENVMHTPSDVMYSKTGMIFGSDTALDFSRLKLTNATVAQNLNHFTQQCIVYDIALGRYSLDQLRKTTDLWSFLKKNTSKTRMIPYVDPDDKKMEFLSCIETVDQMDRLFKKEADYYTKHEIFKQLPINYQMLMSLKNSSSNLIHSQLASVHADSLCKEIVSVNAFNDAAARFGKERAKATQRSTYQIGGSLAGTNLVTLRTILEALIYACCVLILPLSLLPGGIRFIGSWVFLNVWIQLWPPLYAILNYLTMIAAQKYSQSVMGDLSHGFSLFTSAGFQDMAFDMAALGGYLSLSVPILSFYLLQNLQSMAHLPGTLMTPAISSISAAGSELSSGNYSFSNTNMGQISYENQTSFQNNQAPSLSAGYFTDNYGTHQVKYGRDHLTAHQDPSHLNTSISMSEAYTDSLQKAQHSAQSQVDSSQETYSQTRGLAERSTADLIQHVANSEMYSNGYSTSEVVAAQESANWIKNTAQSWGHQHGLSERESLECFASVGIGSTNLIIANSGHSQNCSAMSDEARQTAENIVQSSDYQEHYQRVLNSTQNEAQNSMSDEGRRYAENYSSSMEKLQSAQQQFSSAFSQLNQISENLSHAESHTSSINTNLNTEFSNWLAERNALGALFDRDRTDELDHLRETFIEEKCQTEIGPLENFQMPKEHTNSLQNFDEEWGTLKEATQTKASKANLSFGQSANCDPTLQSQHEALSGAASKILSTQQQDIDGSQASIKDDFNQHHGRSGAGRLSERIQNNLSGICPEISTSWFDDYAKP